MRKKTRNLLCALAILCANMYTLSFASDGYRPLEATSANEGTTEHSFIYEIEVSATAPEQPLLANRLDWASHETIDGNAAPLYSRAYAELDEFANQSLNSMRQTKEYLQFREEHPDADEQNTLELQKMCAQAVPRQNYWGWSAYNNKDEKMRQRYEIFLNLPDEVYEKYYESQELVEVWNTLERASRMRICDWSYTREWNGFATLLPQIQNIREIGRFLQSRAQWKMRLGQLDEARRTIRVMYMVSLHTTQDPSSQCLVSSLVGIAIRLMAQNALTDLLRQPGAANLYWSTSLLREKSITIGSAIEGDLFMVLLNPQKWDTDKLRRPDAMSSDELQEIMQMIIEQIYQCGEFNVSILEGDAQYKRVIAIVATLIWTDAKHRLEKRGLSEEEISQLTIYQVVVPYILEQLQKEYDIIRCQDHCYRITATDHEAQKQFEAKFSGGTEYNRVRFRYPQNIVDTLLAVIVPATQAAGSAERRCAAFDDLLVIIEALRWYAAEHNGKFPESLDDTQMPLIPGICRATGEPFSYRLDGDVAELQIKCTGYTSIWRISIRM